MRNRKMIGILLLLVVLTIGVVLVPQWVSKHRETQRLNEVTYRRYDAASKANLTGTQVARLYYENQIDTSNNLQPAGNAGEDSETIREDILYLTELLFGKEPTMRDSVATLLADHALICYRGSSLIAVDDQPTALHFVTVAIKDNDLVFEIIYEEKTKTVIDFTVDPLATSSQSKEEMEASIRNYYEGQLQLGRDEYEVSVKLSEMTEAEDLGNQANAVIRCSILQAETKEIKEK